MPARKLSTSNPAGFAEKIGQMLVFGWTDSHDGESLTLNSHFRRLIDDFRIGGVILMARNIGARDAARDLISGAQLAASDSGLPGLLVATDQEGGRVARFALPSFPAFPPAAEIGRAASLLIARQNAANIGAMLADVGVNWALMPVLDVNNNPRNVVIGDHPGIVAEMGVSSIRGLQDDAKIMACGKHFPGHGDTDVDSHFALPVIRHGVDRLERCELPPFQAAILAGVGSLMTSHILFPELDQQLPATLSPPIITGLLRRHLGYDGVVITDCLEMKGVSTRWGSAEAAVLAAIAGADMLLCCHTESVQAEIRDALIKAAEDGRLAEERIDEANRRIKIAKSYYG